MPRAGEWRTNGHNLADERAKSSRIAVTDARCSGQAGRQGEADGRGGRTRRTARRTDERDGRGGRTRGTGEADRREGRARGTGEAVGREGRARRTAEADGRGGRELRHVCTGLKSCANRPAANRPPDGTAVWDEYVEFQAGIAQRPRGLRWRGGERRLPPCDCRRSGSRRAGYRCPGPVSGAADAVR